MTRERAELPPLHVAAAALRETTERLAAEVADPGTAAPDWDDLYWAIAQAAATIQGISSVLAARLRWSGPQSWISFMKAQRLHAELRDRRIGEVVEKIDAATRDARICVIALKGAALRPMALYSTGERPMADVDLLVRPDDLPRMHQALESLNYRLANSAMRHSVFLQTQETAACSFGEHERNALPIEVHTSVTESMPVRRIDITGALWPEKPRPGLNPYASAAALMLHLLLHSSANIRKRAIRQIHLHDIALLSQRLELCQWDEIITGRDSAAPRWWLYPPLAVTQRYFPGSIPQNVLAQARSICPPLLRTLMNRAHLTEVSFSNPRIPAFPGLGWSRTPFEAIRFMKSRVMPGKAALDGLRNSVDINQRLRQLSWYELSHFERIVRWALGRAPRVQTLLSLRDALEQAPATAPPEV